MIRQSKGSYAVIVLACSTFACSAQRQGKPETRTPSPVVVGEPILSDAGASEGLQPPIPAWRKVLPGIPSVGPFAPPQVQLETLPNGMRIYLVEDHSLPLMTVSVVVRAGSAEDPSRGRGASSIVAHSLKEATKHRTSPQLDAAVDELASSIDVTTDYNLSSLGISITSADAEAAISILAEIATQPALRTADVERVAHDLSITLRGRLSSSRVEAERVLRAAIWGDRHPYGVLVDGEVSSLLAVKYRDVLAYYSRYWRPDNAALVVAGDASMVELKRLTIKAFGTWKSTGKKPSGALPSLAQAGGGMRIVAVDKPGPSFELWFGTPVASVSSPEWPALMLANQLFGGDYSARLNRVLRQARGLTYNARSRLSRVKGPGMLLMRTNVEEGHVIEAISIIKAEMGRLAKDGFDDDELANARGAAMLYLSFRFNTRSDTVKAVAELFSLDRAPDFYSRLAREFQELPSGAVRDAARAICDPEAYVIVVVGPIKGITSELKAIPDVTAVLAR